MKTKLAMNENIDFCDFSQHNATTLAETEQTELSMGSTGPVPGKLLVLHLWPGQTGLLAMSTGQMPTKCLTFPFRFFRNFKLYF